MEHVMDVQERHVIRDVLDVMAITEFTDIRDAVNASRIPGGLIRENGGVKQNA